MNFIDWLCLFVPCFDEVNFVENKHNTSSASRAAARRWLRVFLI